MEAVLFLLAVSLASVALCLLVSARAPVLLHLLRLVAQHRALPGDYPPWWGKLK